MTLQNLVAAIPRITPYLFPPLIGAIIGYVTNRIAISMLFRPYREKRILGIRIPFTPGIIPRQRYKLSASIGTMVSKHLLTRGAVERQLHSPEFRDRIFTYIEQMLDKLLSSPPGEHLKAIQQAAVTEDGESGGFQGLVKPLFAGVSEALLDYYWERPLEGLFPEGAFTSGLSGLSSRISAEKRLLGDILTYRGVGQLAGLLDARYEDIVGALDRFLQQPIIKKQLEIRGRFFLDDVLSRLSSMQRFMLMAGQYDKALMEKMPSIVEDARQQLHRGLKDKAVRGKIVQWFRVFLLGARKEGIAELFRKLSGGGIDPEGTFIRFTGEITKKIAQIPLCRIASCFGFDNPRAAALSLYDLLFKSRREGGKGGLLSRLLASAPGDYITLTEDNRRSISRGIGNGALVLLDHNIEPILQNVDIHTLVVNRIDELEVERVEELLLVVIKTHLKYINLFGALLGALIGALQILI